MLKEQLKEWEKNYPEYLKQSTGRENIMRIIKGIEEEKHKTRREIVKRLWHKKKKLRKYGLTSRQYDTMYKSRNGCCDICGDVKKVLCVDHDHKTNKVRGLLCGHCNTALGFVRDSPVVLMKAAIYLKEHETPIDETCSK